MWVILDETLSGWFNTSSTEDGDGNRIPVTYATREEAQEALDDLLASLEEAGMEPGNYMLAEVASPTEQWDSGE